MALSCAQEFVSFVILTSYLNLPELDSQPEADLLEYFSGKARVSKFAARCGLHVRCFDISYGDKRPRKWKNGLKRKRQCMDICGDAGFTHLGSKLASHHLVPRLCLLAFVCSGFACF